MQCASTICHLCPTWLCSIFPHYLINGTIFERKKLLNTKCVFWFYLQILSATFPILGRIERDTEWMILNVYRSAYKPPLFLSDFNANWIFSADFRKSSNIKFHENPSSGNRVVPCERTDGRTDMTKLIVAFRNSENASKNDLWFYAPEYLHATWFTYRWFVSEITRI